MDESHLSRQILYDEKDCHQMLPGAVAAAQGIPWMHGACAGSVGMSFTVLPGLGPCFCCFVPRSPAPGELLTCDTAGLMGPAASTVAALEVAQALRVLLGKADDAVTGLVLPGPTSGWGRRTKPRSSVARGIAAAPDQGAGEVCDPVFQ